MHQVPILQLSNAQKHKIYNENLPLKSQKLEILHFGRYKNFNDENLMGFHEVQQFRAVLMQTAIQFAFAVP